MYKVISCIVSDLISGPVIELSVPENGVLTHYDVKSFFKEHPQATRIKIPEGWSVLGRVHF